MRATILKKIRELVSNIDPTAKVYLFGSRARKTFHSESDWDILILVRDSEITTTLEKKFTDPLYDLELELGEVISPMIYSDKDWNAKYKVTSFYDNVMHDGVMLLENT